jgi:anti-sigma regulatory factor (Ser/Thr protein kinase)
MTVPSWCYETTLAAQPVSAPRARAFVCRHLVAHGLGYLVDPVRLVVSELATDAVVHARGSFTVTLSCTERTVLLEVRDKAPEPRVPAQVQRTGLSQRGVRIVQIISTDWGVVSDGPGVLTVWASFDLRRHQLA